MKRSYLLVTLLSAGLIFAAVHRVHGLTVAEQAEDFYQRGLAAEKREDFIAAGNCYTLTLRVNPGHAESLARMADLEERNVFGTEAKAKVIILPNLEYNVTNRDAAEREAKFSDTLALLERLTGLDIVLETDGEPILQHSLYLREVSLDEALSQIATKAGLTVSYERDLIHLSPKTGLPRASPETRATLSRLNEQFQAALAALSAPGKAELEKLAATYDSALVAISSAVGANPDEVAVVNAERSKVGYTIRSLIAADQPGSFSTGAEGWALFDTKGAKTQPVDHHAAGYLDGKDLIQGSDYYFSAPQSVLDQIHEATLEDSISFDFYTTGSDIGKKDTLVLESPGMTLVLPVSNPPNREWKQFSYRFDPSAGWKIGMIGKLGKKPAKTSEIQRALATATKLYIRGEWKTGPDAARLDNVSITATGTPVNSSPTTGKPSLTSVAPFTPGPPAITPTMLEKKPVPSTAEALGKPDSTPVQPDPKADFKGWLKTVQLVHVTGNKFTINDDEVLQLNPSAGLARFKPIKIDLENRTVTWERPDFTAKLTVTADLKSFQYAHKTDETEVKGNRVEPRDPAIFDGKPATQPAPASVPKPLAPKPIAPKPSTAPPVKPQENSLGMKFVPVPGSKVLFCIHETRRQDYAAFATAVPGTDETWKTAQRNGVPCGHRDDHPVVGVSRDEARIFCDWLSKKEGKVYRLPSDEEWSLAVGVAEFEKRTAESTPELLNMKEKTRFPWGDNYPPNGGEPVGNYADTKWKETFPSEGIVEGYTDHFDTTAPVMSFKANSFGLFDLGGNVWEWIDDPWQGAALGGPVVRGAGFSSSGQGALLSSRRSRSGLPRPPDTGFRVIIVIK
ncbi:MAG: SUMF1/EgtB/PvdO family nonheme iron enzyme [Verrucomicrobiales bacterium]|nr:SUMF1/EgtB/PvdO family nonheme iron enzyme [Verrucomicrobiales bacterium]